LRREQVDPCALSKPGAVKGPAGPDTEDRGGDFRNGTADGRRKCWRDKAGVEHFRSAPDSFPEQARQRRSGLLARHMIPAEDLGPRRGPQKCFGDGAVGGAR
jgi:hypothetical protein